MTLTLIDIRQVKDPQPAAFHESAAARYLGMNRTSFRQLLKLGVIPFAMHANGKTRIFLRDDLDAYLSKLDKRTMCPRENPLVAVKGETR